MPTIIQAWEQGHFASRLNGKNADQTMQDIRDFIQHCYSSYHCTPFHSYDN